MPTVPLRIDHATQADLFAAGFEDIRARLHIEVEHPPEAVAEAARAVARGPAIPADYTDLRHLPFFTVDPPGSRDLDQAVHIERAKANAGWVVQYAIADVAAFVTPGGALDQAARSRGVTIYLPPDRKAPLHPPVLSEGAASLLPGEDRPALVWRIEVDGAGEATHVDVRRAIVRSRHALSYEQVQNDEDRLALLREVGQAREHRQAERGGLDLRLPDQAVVQSRDHDGTYRLEYRAPLPAEGWNAQVSLLAGECAAALMLDLGMGVLRTLPPPGEGTVARLRRHAKALDVPWPNDTGYAEFLRTLDPAVPDHAALIVQSASLARGASYHAFTERPADVAAVTHSAVAAPYAHVTAPLRRLVDRFANELVLAACAGTTPPSWAVDALPLLPDLMRSARERERAAERMTIELVESVVLARCGTTDLRGVVVDVDQRRDRDRATVQVLRPAVVTEVPRGSLALGDEVRVHVEGGRVTAS